MFELPRAGMNGEAKPDAYEPDKNPEYFEGVLPRRVVAFCVDAVLIVGPIILLALFIFVFGLVTFGLGWFLFWMLSPVFVIWAILYVGIHARLAPFGHDRHAHARSGIAHLVRRPDVFPARRGARDLFLGFGERR